MKMDSEIPPLGGKKFIPKILLILSIIYKTRTLEMIKDVLIIGGGIAGIQASLDLADMGIKVHLVEKLPSIGGKMAQLDKTFPTNDCAI
jgi:heterodisulfide reductase subunit A-like polyferredoxin